MTTNGVRGLLGMAAVAVTATIAACGGSSATSSVSAGPKPALDGSGEQLSGGLRGGTLTVYDHADFQTMDPVRRTRRSRAR
jgi:hypothetical protein